MTILRAVTPARCGECDFVFRASPALLRRTLSRTGAGYERATHAVFAVCGPGDEVGGSILDGLIHVRDAVHRYSTWLMRVSGADQAELNDLDPEPMPPVALDHTWGAITGLLANIDDLATVIETFPSHRWNHQGLLGGAPVSAVDLANYGVHEAVHHLLELERTVEAHFLDPHRGERHN